MVNVEMGTGPTRGSALGGNMHAHMVR